MTADKILPPDIKLYDVGNQNLFEIRNKAGLIVEPDTRIAYLVKVVDGTYFRYAFKWMHLDLAIKNMSPKDLIPQVENTFRVAIAEFNSFLADPVKLEEARKNQGTLIQN